MRATSGLGITIAQGKLGFIHTHELKNKIQALESIKKKSYIVSLATTVFKKTVCYETPR